MIFSLFKDTETIELANQLSKMFLEIVDILKKLKKDELNKQNIVETFQKKLKSNLVASIDDMHDIKIIINNRYLSMTLSRDYSSEDRQNYQNYNLSLVGIYDYQGFSIMLDSKDKKPTVGLLDMTKLFSGGKKPGKKAKVLFEEISKSERFKSSVS